MKKYLENQLIDDAIFDLSLKTVAPDLNDVDRMYFNNTTAVSDRETVLFHLNLGEPFVEIQQMIPISMTRMMTVARNDFLRFLIRLDDSGFRSVVLACAFMWLTWRDVHHWSSIAFGLLSMFFSAIVFKNVIERIEKATRS